MAALITFFALCYVLTWSLWHLAGSTSATGFRGVIFLIGVYIPGIVAIVLTAISSGRSGLRKLLRHLFDWNVPLRWYAFAVSYIAAIKLTVALILRISTGSWPQFGAVPWYLMIAATLGSTLVGGQAGEEIGWRGYALPRLASRLGLGGASVLLGILWACWHLPLFFFPDSDMFGQSFPLYLLQVIAVSVAIAWLYGNTRGSLLLTMLMHAAINNTKDIVPSAETKATNAWALSHSPVAWLTVAILWLCAIFFLIQMRRKRESISEWMRSIAS